MTTNQHAISPANPNGLTDEWLDRLFVRLASMYGRHWLAMWEEIPMPDVKDTWRKGLARISGEQIAKALDHCRMHHPFPPTLPEFVGLCRTFAIKQAALPDYRADAMPPDIRAEIARLFDEQGKRDKKDWARTILKEHAEGTYNHRYGVMCARRALGIREEEPVA